jgi:two-component sensor histidine kinase
MQRRSIVHFVERQLIVGTQSSLAPKSDVTIRPSTVDIRPADLVTVRTQLPRPAHRPDLRAQLARTCELSAIILTDPVAAIPRILASAMALCRAGSAGVSLLIRNQAHVAILRWEHVSGKLCSEVGFESPRGENPCGLCLDSGETVVIRQPERAFPNLKSIQPAIVEQLIVPLRDRAYRPFGTLWIAAHETGARLSFEDARIVEQLASQLTLALQLIEQAREWILVLEQRQLLTRELVEAERLRLASESAHCELNTKLAAAGVAIREANHRVKNTLATAAGLLSLHGRATSDAMVREELQVSRSRLAALSMVHEVLAETADSTQEISMQPLLALIVGALQELFAASGERVRVLVTADAITLRADEAIPIALVVNEAVTNAYKHAFVAGSSGTVAVHLSDLPSQGLVLRIMDDGIGMHDARSDDGLGFTLMRSLADQLNGALTFTRPADVSGTVITLRRYRSVPEARIA